jgi:NAD(P)-dependent dehydrogenase (short-subunit alcohol dehydrogenase family)
MSLAVHERRLLSRNERAIVGTKVFTMMTWLITGASSGLGAELARVVLERGDRVVAVAGNVERMQALTAAFPTTALALELDVTDRAQIKEVFARAEAHFDGINVLVNNAGVVYLATVEEGEDEQIAALFNVNFFAVAACTRAVLPGMRARGNGVIVNISSSSGVIGLPSLGYYAASKHALEGLTAALWHEVEPLGIGVLLIEPGGVGTGFISRSLRSDRITAYAQTAGTLRDRLETADKTHFNSDPKRVANAIYDCVCGERPLSHRLILGSDAYDSIVAELESRRADHEQWEAVSRQTDWQ